MLRFNNSLLLGSFVFDLEAVFAQKDLAVEVVRNKNTVYNMGRCLETI